MTTFFSYLQEFRLQLQWVLDQGSICLDHEAKLLAKPICHSLLAAEKITGHQILGDSGEDQIDWD